MAEKKLKRMPSARIASERTAAMPGSATPRSTERSASAGFLLLVEQDVMNALELADRAYLIDHGRVTKHGSAASLANDPAIREAHMGIA